MLGLALAQLPAEDLDREILVRTDIGGCTHAFTADCREASIRFSVGYELNDTVRQVILDLPETAWVRAINSDGGERDGAWVTELTEHLDLSAWPAGSRLIVRRERPHPGAQFTIFDEHGYRHICFLTDQGSENIAELELRHRGRARVEDSIRAGKDTGMRNLPHYAFEHNQTWLEVSLIAQDLLAWTKLICLEGELVKAEPKRLRHLLLHTAGKLVTHARRTFPLLHRRDDQGRPLPVQHGELPSMHSFRHTVASRALLAGESVDEIAFLLGHRDANVTRAVYVRELADTRRRSMRRSRMLAEYGDLLKQ